MRSFQQRLSDFNARGIRLVAISVDPPEVSREHWQRLGFTYTVLSDVKGEVTARYDLQHKAGGPQKADIARPAEFLVDAGGTIRWRNLTDSIVVRARPDQVLQALEESKLTVPGR